MPGFSASLFQSESGLILLPYRDSFRLVTSESLAGRLFAAFGFAGHFMSPSCVFVAWTMLALTASRIRSRLTYCVRLTFPYTAGDCLPS